MARDDVLAHVVRTYFAGSPDGSHSSLRMSATEIDATEIEKLRSTIRRARQSGK